MIHVATDDIVSFFFMAEYYSVVYKYYIIFIHPSVDGHRGCSLVLAIVCSAAEKSGVCVSFWIMVFSGYMPSSGISGSDVSKYFQVIPEKCKNLNDITSNVTIIFSF